MGSQLMRIETPNLRPLERYYKYTAPLFGAEVTKSTVEELASFTADAARTYIDQYVYNTELPSGSVRTHRTYDAITPKQGATAKTTPLEGGMGHTAGAFVDPTDYPAYFYAEILNFGGRGGAYKPRPFWTMAVTKAKAQAKAVGRRNLKNYRDMIANGG